MSDLPGGVFNGGAAGVCCFALGAGEGLVGGDFGDCAAPHGVEFCGSVLGAGMGARGGGFGISCKDVLVTSSVACWLGVRTNAEGQTQKPSKGVRKTSI